MCSAIINKDNGWWDTKAIMWWIMMKYDGGADAVMLQVVNK